MTTTDDDRPLASGWTQHLLTDSARLRDAARPPGRRGGAPRPPPDEETLRRHRRRRHWICGGRCHAARGRYLSRAAPLPARSGGGRRQGRCGFRWPSPSVRPSEYKTGSRDVRSDAAFLGLGVFFSTVSSKTTSTAEALKRRPAFGRVGFGRGKRKRFPGRLFPVSRVNFLKTKCVR